MKAVRMAMMAVDAEERLLTPTEVGGVVRAVRGAMGWTQETLAELAGLTGRTVQRLEVGQASSLTRRAVCRAFGWDDLDALSKPKAVPTEEGLEKQKAVPTEEGLEKQKARQTAPLLVLPAEVADGHRIATLIMAVTGHVIVCPSAPAEVSCAVQDAFAAVADFLRGLLDAVPDATMTEMLGYGDTLDELLELLKAEGHCLGVGIRKMSLMGRGEAAAAGGCALPRRGTRGPARAADGGDEEAGPGLIGQWRQEKLWKGASPPECGV
jgi:transcriptional regulator with XRE-family HTH domain